MQRTLFADCCCILWKDRLHKLDAQVRSSTPNLDPELVRV
jgi:hypothetical protein